MDPRSPSFEANLIYKAAQNPDVDTLVEEIRETLEAHSVILLYAEKVDGVFTLLTCDRMQILLAFTDVSLPVEHFLEAQRPAATATGETEVLAKLNAHQSNITVLVVDHETGGPEPTQWHDHQKRTLCWEIADCIAHVAPPDLVFWCDEDMLYTFDEFQRACTFYEGHSTPALPYVDAFDHSTHPFSEAPVISATTLNWINEQIEESRDVRDPYSDHKDGLTMETVMKVTLPSFLAHQLDRIRGTKDHGFRALRTAAMVGAAAAVCSVGYTAVPTVFY